MASGIRNVVTTGSVDEIMTPVGVYTVGNRYRFFIAPWQDTDVMSYLALDGNGELIDGLGAPGLEEGIATLVAHTGQTATQSLAALARQINDLDATDDRGELVDFVFGPEPEFTSEGNPAFFPASNDEIGPASAPTDVEVHLSGAVPGESYGLRGSKILGWYFTNADGQNELRGRIPPGERLELVHRNPDGSVEAIDGAPLLAVDSTTDVLRALYEFDDAGLVTLRTDLSLAEIDTLMRADLGLPAESDR